MQNYRQTINLQYHCKKFEFILRYLIGKVTFENPKK